MAVLVVGACAALAILGLADRAAVRPAPGVQRADELITAYARPTGRDAIRGISHLTALQLMRPVPAFASAAAYAPFTVDILVGSDGVARRAQAHVVTPGYFETLGVRGVRGRTFLPEEGDVDAEHAVAVVSDAFWKTALEGDPEILGRVLDIDRRRFTVVGVAPAEFVGPRRGDAVAVWLPASAFPAVRARFTGHVLMLERAPVWLGIVGRLRAGATAADVAAQLERAVPAPGFEIRVEPGVGPSWPARVSRTCSGPWVDSSGC